MHHLFHPPVLNTFVEIGSVKKPKNFFCAPTTMLQFVPCSDIVLPFRVVGILSDLGRGKVRCRGSCSGK